jgi:hypothetical protein
MDVDETSKLWGMLHQTPYALSVVYQAVLVLIDGRETPVPAKPVERPEVRVLPFGAPGAPSPGPVPEEPAVPPSPPSPEAEQPADPPAKAVAVARTEAKAPAKTARGRKAAQPARSAKKTAAKPAKSARTQPASRNTDGDGAAHADGSEGTEN